LFADGCEMSKTASASFLVKLDWREIAMARWTAAMGAPRSLACCNRESSSPAHTGAEISASRIAAKDPIKYRMTSPDAGC
jgi:hypothetical protein